MTTAINAVAETRPILLAAVDALKRAHSRVSTAIGTSATRGVSAILVTCEFTESVSRTTTATSAKVTMNSTRNVAVHAANHAPTKIKSAPKSAMRAVFVSPDLPGSTASACRKTGAKNAPEITSSSQSVEVVAWSHVHCLAGSARRNVTRVASVSPVSCELMTNASKKTNASSVTIPWKYSPIVEIGA